MEFRWFGKNYEFGRKREKEEERNFDDMLWTNPILGTISLTSYNTYSSSQSMKISSVYRAVSVIADSVAILPLENYKYEGNWKHRNYDDLYYLLNVQPNENMSAYTFKNMIIQYMLLKGNAYIRVYRNKSKIQKLVLLNSDEWTVALQEGVKKYVNILTNEMIDDADCIHIMNGYTSHGLIGMSTISAAATTLGIAYASDEYAKGFFEGGGSMAGILSPVAGTNISPAKATKAKEDFMTALNSNLGGKPNSIIVLDAGLQYSPISINPKDSQLLESRQFSMISISQFFGVPPSKIFDLSKSSYASVEASQIDFLNSTIQPICEKIEIEFYRKLFTKVEYDKTELKFDVSNLLRMDSQAQATYFSQMYQIGVYSTNEIREKLNSEYPVTGGNEHFIQVNLQKLSDPLVNNKTQLDNKLK